MTCARAYQTWGGRRSAKPVRYLITCTLAAMLSGCGGTPLAPVEGVVTLNGKPLPKAAVTLQRSTGEISQRVFKGTTDDSGRYVAASLEGSDQGVPPGSYTVLISTVVIPPGASELTPLPKEIVPLPFRDGSQVLEVPAEGLTSADFTMTTR